MILLYTMLLFLLGAIKLLVSLRTRILERKFTRVAASVHQLLNQPEYRGGTTNRTDPCASAKRMLLLGQRVEERDRVEVQYFAWQRCKDRLEGWVRSLRQWKGKKLPYTLGAVDVGMLFCVVDYFGVGEYLSASALIQHVVALYHE